MKALRNYSAALCFTLVAMSACNDSGNDTTTKEEPAVNVSDSRRNTGGSVNTITGDSNKVATDSAQHGIRNKKRENM